MTHDVDKVAFRNIRETAKESENIIDSSMFWMSGSLVENQEVSQQENGNTKVVFRKMKESLEVSTT